MSATQSLFGPVARKSRQTRSLAGLWLGSRCVVVGKRRLETPRNPATRISRATRLRATAVPSACNSACTRGAP